MVNIVMIGLAKEISPKEEKHELHRLLGVLLSEIIIEDELYSHLSFHEILYTII